MIEMPEDIQQTARDCVDNFDSDYVENWPDIIARAILAERQRCADIANQEAIDFKENGLAKHCQGAIFVRKAILRSNT